MPTVVFDPITGVTRETLLEAFRKENIDARVFFWPLSGLPPFGDIVAHPVAGDISARAMNLPSLHDMTPNDIHRVSTTSRNAW